MGDLLAARPDRKARWRLFCFPHAGAGASAYRAWPERLRAAGVAVCPIRLPGRENRFGEPAHRAVEPLVRDLLDGGLAEELDRPYALFGHSMGALVAFELVRAVHRLSGPLPVRLFVSGRIAPQLADPRGRMHELDDAELLDRLARLGGIPQGVLADPDLMAWQLPLLRADLAVNENYRCPPGPPLPVPITAFGGARDPKVTEAELGGWAAQSSVGARTHLLPGGHFFVQESMNELLRLVMSELVDPPDSAPTTIRSVAR